MVAGLITPVFGLGPARLILDWWASWGRIVLRAAGVFAVAFGGTLWFLLSPKARAA
jgi:hypothetical protein